MVAENDASKKSEMNGEVSSFRLLWGGESFPGRFDPTPGG